MTIKDIGPAPQAFDLETATVENPNYRAVAWSGKYLQLTLMSIPVGGDVGLESHPETDQFLRLDAGRGRVQMGPAEGPARRRPGGRGRLGDLRTGWHLAQRHQYR